VLFRSPRAMNRESSCSERPELLEEAQIVVEEESEIAHPVAQHREPIDSHAPRVARVALRIDAARHEHVGMHHATAGDLEPAGVLAGAAALALAEHTGHVDFGGRLGKGEVRGPKAHREITLEERLQEPVQRRLHVGEADVLVDLESLDLVEHWRVRHVGIAPIDPSWRHDCDRRALAQHGADLHRRGMRAQEAPVREIERVVHRPRGVIGREVERLEVVEIVLDLRTRGDLEARAAKDLLHAQARQRDWMEPAALLAAARQRDVDAAGGELPLDIRPRQRLAPRLDGSPHPLLGLVDPLAGRRPLGGREAAQGFQLLGEGALLPEPAYPCLIEAGEVRARRHLAQSLVYEGGQVLHGARPALGYAMPSAVFACWAMAANATLSCTAMSANTLRSTSRPALPSPLMMRL